MPKIRRNPYHYLEASVWASFSHCFYSSISSNILFHDADALEKDQRFTVKFMKALRYISQLTLGISVEL